MARKNDSFPSWMTVLRNQPKTGNPLLDWLRGIGIDIIREWFGDLIRDTKVGAANAAERDAARNLDLFKQAVANTLGMEVNNAAQNVSKWIIDKMRGKRPTEAEAREMIAAELKKNQEVRELMRMLGVKGLLMYSPYRSSW
jgi:hypothetical protein